MIVHPPPYYLFLCNQSMYSLSQYTQVCRSEAPSPSADIWSTMCLLIQMLTAEAPWEEYRHQSDNLLFVVS